MSTRSNGRGLLKRHLVHLTYALGNVTVEFGVPCPYSPQPLPPLPHPETLAPAREHRLLGANSGPAARDDFGPGDQVDSGAGTHAAARLWQTATVHGMPARADQLHVGHGVEAGPGCLMSGAAPVGPGVLDWLEMSTGMSLSGASSGSQPEPGESLGLRWQGGSSDL